ncbi:uncharacterized protein LOC127291620 [Leptopilina boulardi]|uniref:uncharacterized protein LOC127291620 n=1 Tax=Leptopilina boulardi TaxID=63433 RepID=UPI0021F59FEF|nr:uncharacterized protein LOC127291620 [Leptopilina boulardi]
MDDIPNILWTDECIFTREGIFNTKNEHHYAEDNPFLHRETHFQRRFKLNIWAGMIDDVIIGPYLLPDRMTGARYLTFLQEELPHLLEDLPLERRRRLIFMHDGCPIHRTGDVVRHLNQTYRKNWIGYKLREGNHRRWPPRSPDMTPLDFFLWGHLKTLVYKDPLPDNEQEAELELIARIHAAIATITPEMVRNATGNVVTRARKCLQARGGHFQARMKVQDLI